MTLITDGLVDRVLARLGIAVPPPTGPGLAILYRAWCEHVPWDNVQKRITVASRREPLAGAHPAEFFENFVRDGTGGTCWPSAGALHALLVHLGFRARRGVAVMSPERFGRVENHATTIVNVDGGDVVVDSSILHVDPLPLREGARIDHPAHRAFVERHDGEWVIRWLTHAREVELTCVLLEDDVPFDRYLRRYEASRTTGFSYRLTFTRGHLGGVLSVNGSERAFRAPDGSLSAAAVADRDRVLVEEGGLSPSVVARLPPDEPDPNRPA